ncbi:hypothetical protein B0H66DRAFT_168333 [Apodospora peruviana]|uniref:CBM-cenC domain-containing protein n=1 Tax=Apodospora peruviana TaxID=516989 RepID=A0AAE0MC41_9PEZI|nr:hypothetical protein B0H66DRAFT_168333 [Apodospora peruviana]
MKLLCFGLGAGVLVGVANAACAGSPCGGRKCYGAIGVDHTVGESFCSSWLQLAPATTTVTEIETATSTLVNIETTATTLTLTTGTITQTGSNPTTIFQKKRAPTPVQSFSSAEPAESSPADPTEAIVSVCSANNERITKACSCFLSTATQSTVTVFETAVSTAVAEAISTIVSTVTEKVVATTSVAAAPIVIPSNVVVNGNLESYLTTGNINPWGIFAPTGGRVEVINGVNPCTTGGAYCAGGSVVVRVFPPTTGGGFVAMQETFVARPSTTYNFSFMFRCLNFDTNAGMIVYYAGARVGSVNCPNINSSAFQRSTGIQFTTDATGRGELQIRFANPSNLQYLYVYADDFQAIKA